MGRINVTFTIFGELRAPTTQSFTFLACHKEALQCFVPYMLPLQLHAEPPCPLKYILAEGAIALSVTLSGGALFAS